MAKTLSATNIAIDPSAGTGLFASMFRRILANAMRGAVEDVLKGPFNEIREDIRELKTDVREMKADICELKKDVAVLKADVAVLKADVAVLKADVAELKVIVGRHDSELVALRRLEPEIVQVRDNLAILSIRVTSEVAQLKESFGDFREKVGARFDVLKEDMAALKIAHFTTADLFNRMGRLEDRAFARTQ